MKVWEEILERLRSGEDFGEVRSAYRSASQFAMALRVYVDELMERAEEGRDEFGEVEERHAEEEAEVQGLRVEKGSLIKEVDALRASETDLRGRVDGAVEELKQASAAFEELKRRGFDKDLFQKLRGLAGKTADDVWVALRDAEKAQKVRDEVAINLNRLDEINDETGLVTRKRDKVKREVASVEKKLKRAKVRLNVYGGILEVVDLAIENGVKGGEVRDLLDGLVVVKELVGLKGEIGSAEVRLAELLRQEREVKARLEVMGDAGLKAVDDMREEFSRAVDSVASQARMEVESLASGFGSDLKRRYALVEEVALLRKEKEEIQSLIGPARVLMCVLESPDALRHVPISVVFQLLDRIGLWSERILPEGRFRVNLDFANGKLCSASTGAFSITIESLVKVTTEALQMQLARSDRERNSVMR